MCVAQIHSMSELLKLTLQLTVYNYNGGPCYRCLFPTPPPTTACQRCSDSGVLGVGKNNGIMSMIFSIMMSKYRPDHCSVNE